MNFVSKLAAAQCASGHKGGYPRKGSPRYSEEVETYFKLRRAHTGVKSCSQTSHPMMGGGGIEGHCCHEIPLQVVVGNSNGRSKALGTNKTLVLTA